MVLIWWVIEFCSWFSSFLFSMVFILFNCEFSVFFFFGWMVNEVSLFFSVIMVFWCLGRGVCLILVLSVFNDCSYCCVIECCWFLVCCCWVFVLLNIMLFVVLNVNYNLDLICLFVGLICFYCCCRDFVCLYVFVVLFCDESNLVCFIRVVFCLWLCCIYGDNKLFICLLILF